MTATLLIVGRFLLGVYFLQAGIRNFNLEIGAAYLAEGSFQDRASAGQGRDATYGYVQTTLTF